MQSQSQDQSADINSGPIDRWSIVHGLSGLGVGLMGLPIWMSTLGAASYEMIEYAHEWPAGSWLFGSKGPESLQNLIGDSIVYMSMFAIGRSLRARPRAEDIAWTALIGGAIVGLVLMPDAEHRLQPAPPGG